MYSSSSETDDQRKIFANNLTQLMKSRGINQSQLSADLNIAGTTISSWVQGKRYPRVDKIKLLADYFNVKKSDLTEDNNSIDKMYDLEELLKDPNRLLAAVEDIQQSYNATLPPGSVNRITTAKHKIPVYGSISAGIPLEAIENLAETSVPDHITEKHKRENLFGLLVRGDSMNKIVPDGLYAILCKTESVDSGDVAAVIVNGYDATLKRVLPLDRGVLLEPASYNSEHKPQMYLDEEAKEIKVIGKLVGIVSPPDFKF